MLPLSTKYCLEVKFILIDKKLKRYIKGLKNQINVINALLFRELTTKKSFSYLGFFGVIFEPLIVTGIYLITLRLIRARIDVGINPILFFGTGIILYSFFISTFTRSLSAIEANRNLFYYRQVKPIDTVIARTLIEIMVISIVYSLILAIVFYFNSRIILDNLPLLIGTFILITILSFSVGVLALIIGYKFKWIRKFTPVFTRPIFFTSGSLFSVNLIPNEFKKYVLWNPLMHASELARYSLDNNYVLYKEISLTYLMYVAFLIFSISILIYQKIEQSLLVK
tara:strand:+ start:718 stop:1563 length:846 start_codon:yes stop_codon:yes gene_type:complete